MGTYSASDFAQIAAAVDRKVDDVAAEVSALEEAALGYRLDSGRPRRMTPSRLRAKMNQIAKAARRLLGHLGVQSAEDAYDGVGDLEILAALATVTDNGEDALTIATRRIGRLTELSEAAGLLESSAIKAAAKVAKVGRLTVEPGNVGDVATNNWIAAMMEIYEKITGNRPTTSVDAPHQANEGIAGGPLIRFLQAAGQPSEIQYGEDAWRSRVRTILDQ